MEGRAIPRDGYAVQSKGEAIGVVTSGTLSPTLVLASPWRGLTRDLAVESLVDVVIRGVPHPARVVPLPFVPRTTRSTEVPRARF
jgi:aminomethyltransferase